MLFGEAKPNTDYIVLTETRGCPVDRGDVFYLTDFGEMDIRTRRRTLRANEVPKQIPATLEIKEYTDDDYCNRLKCISSGDPMYIEEVAKEYYQQAISLAKRGNSWQMGSAILYLQISEWLQDYIELQHTVNDLVNEFGLSTIEDFYSMIYKPKDK